MKLDTDKKKNIAQTKAVIQKLTTNVPFGIGKSLDLLYTAQLEGRLIDIEDKIDLLFTFIEEHNGNQVGAEILKISELSNIDGIGFRKPFFTLAIVAELQKTVINGISYKRSIPRDEILKLISEKGANNPEIIMLQCVDDLLQKGLVRILPTTDNVQYFTELMISEDFTCETDSLFREWAPVEDAKELIRYAINSEYKNSQTIHNVKKDYPSWSDHRINSAIRFMQNNYLIQDDGGRVADGGQLFQYDYTLSIEAYHFIED